MGNYTHQLVKMLALAGTVGLLAAIFAPPLIAATIGVGTLYVVCAIAG